MWINLHVYYRIITAGIRLKNNRKVLQIDENWNNTKFRKRY